MLRYLGAEGAEPLNKLGEDIQVLSNLSGEALSKLGTKQLSDLADQTPSVL